MKEKLKYIRFSAIKPAGWMLKQMQKDVKDGFVGHLDELVPDLIKNDDIYGKNRLTMDVKKKDLGVETIDHPSVHVAFLWWNSETQSNWLDGLVRNAFLTDDKEFIKKSENYVKRLLSYQDDDGYLGIYSRELRFNFHSENGELWAQSSLFRVLLGYYEATGEEAVLQAVQRAVNRIMEAYPYHHSSPFKVETCGHGVCHGLTITDSFERLYQLTGNETYLKYAEWLYEEYCKYDLYEDDIQMKHLLDPHRAFQGHGAHTYSHLRSLVIAYYTSEDEKYKKALDAYMDKLASCISPSGGPIGDEWISGNVADATKVGYEYCSMQDLLDSYTLLLQKTGEMKYADRIEWLLYNAAQGARHPQESAIAYLKTDNSYAMEGVFQDESQADSEKVQLRYMYSPTHQKTAVCCSPNAGRIYPYYVRSMFMTNEEGIVAALFGPCKLNTFINDVKVEMEMETKYPFDLNIKFKMRMDKPVEFKLQIRKPSWATHVHLDKPDLVLQDDKDFIVLQKVWETGDKITINFDTEIKTTVDNHGDYYVSRGPLLYALPIKSKEEVAHHFDTGHFKELKYARAEEIPTHFSMTDESLTTSKFVKKESDENDVWQHNACFIKLLNSHTAMLEEVELVPIGSTLLRKVTFTKH